MAGAECTGIGARLCTIGELIDGVGSNACGDHSSNMAGTQGYVTDGEAAWSSTMCRSNVTNESAFWAVEPMRGGIPSCVLGNASATIRCCADVLNHTWPCGNRSSGSLPRISKGDGGVLVPWVLLDKGLLADGRRSPDCGFLVEPAADREVFDTPQLRLLLGKAVFMSSALFILACVAMCLVLYAYSHASVALRRQQRLQNGDSTPYHGGTTDIAPSSTTRMRGEQRAVAPHTNSASQHVILGTDARRDQRHWSRSVTV